MNSQRSFDPDAPGARPLAQTWLPHLERRRMRRLHGLFLEDDGNVVRPGETMPPTLEVRDGTG
jgi:hypothetical protein